MAWLGPEDIAGRITTRFSTHARLVLKLLVPRNGLLLSGMKSRGKVHEDAMVSSASLLEPYDLDDDGGVRNLANDQNKRVSGVNGVRFVTNGARFVTNGVKFITRSSTHVSDTEDSLRAQINRLTEENSRLRLEKQRALHPMAAAEQLSHRVNQLDQPGTSEEERLQHEAELLAIRNTLIAAVDEFSASVGHLRQQLIAGLPAPELDRRVLPDRRRANRQASASSDVKRRSTDNSALVTASKADVVEEAEEIVVSENAVNESSLVDQLAKPEMVLEPIEKSLLKNPAPKKKTNWQKQLAKKSTKKRSSANKHSSQNVS